MTHRCPAAPAPHPALAQVKGSNVCELCKAPVRNLPALPPRPAHVEYEDHVMPGALSTRIRQPSCAWQSSLVVAWLAEGSPAEYEAGECRGRRAQAVPSSRGPCT